MRVFAFHCLPLSLCFSIIVQVIVCLSILFTCSEYSPEAIDAAWEAMERAEREKSKAVRDNMFRFITKATSGVSEDQIREFESSFAHFDKDGTYL